MTLKQRFWAKVEKSAYCWEWQASVTSFGYGQLSRKHGKSMYSAHRLSWEMHNGPIPPGLCVLHRCDNRKCVRPDHLFLGTKADNSADMMAKGRHWYIPAPKDFDPALRPRGEGHGMAKLSDDIVREIRALYGIGGMDQRALARHFGVSQPTVGRVLRGETWKHVA